MATSERRTFGIRLRLFAISVGLVLVALLGAWWYVARALDSDVEARLRGELEGRSAMVAATLQSVGASEPGALRGALEAQGRASGLSLALERDGRPVGRAGPAAGAAPLLSHTRAWEEGGARLSLRAELPGQVSSAAVAAMRQMLLFGGLLGLLVSALMSTLAAHWLSGPVRALTETARAMVRDGTVRTRVHSEDEVGELARALDELADGLTSSMQSLRNERDQLAAILDAMVEGVLVTDGDGAIVATNGALREMLLVRREVLGQTPIEAIRNDDLHELIAEVARTGAAVSRELEVGGMKPRRVMVRVAPLGGGEGGTVTVLSDVTELRRLESLRRDFVANVSHELRTPVAAVLAATETLQDGALGDPAMATEFVGIIARHSERLHRLVEDLLELSRIEARQLKLQLETVDVAGAAAHAVELFRLAAGKKRIQCGTSLGDDLPLVRVDRSALEHVLSNLIDNAIKYCPEGARVTVRAQRRGAQVRLSVEDNGAGIDARHLPRLFERFYRVDTGRSRALGGTGLGLAIVKHLVEAMGGEVSVESAVGKGTSFHVDLPALAQTVA